MNDVALPLASRASLFALCMAVCCSAMAATDAATETDPLAEPAAKTVSAETADTEDPLWEWNLAAYARYGPSYPASENSQLNIVPLPLPVYRGKILRVGDSEDKPISTRIFRRDNIKLDIDFGLNFPVDSEEVDARTGMPDLDLLLEVGPRLELQFADSPKHGDLFLDLELRGALSFDSLDPTWRGLVFSTSLKYVRPIKLAKRTELKIDLTPEWANNEYMDFFYGVAPEFGVPGREEYRAKGGYLGTKLGFGIKQILNDDFQIRTGIRFGFYQGARNRNSSLYTDDTNVGVYFAFLWKFWESQRMVTAE